MKSANFLFFFYTVQREDAQKPQLKVEIEKPSILYMIKQY